MRKLFWLLLTTALVLISSGCVSNKAYNAQQDNIQTLQASLNSQAAILEMARKDIIDNREKIDELIVRMQGSGKLTTTAAKDEQIAQIEAELAALRKTLYSTTDNMSSATLAASASESLAVKRELAQIREENARLDRIMDDLALEIKARAEYRVSGNQKEPSAPDQTMSGIYQAALAEYNLGNYDRSIALFDELIKSYPKGELVPNAHYWIAEDYYSKADFATALRHFENTAKLYPDHPKGIDAQMKIGVAYYKLDDKANARAKLNSFKNKYPAYERMDMVDYYLDLVK